MKKFCILFLLLSAVVFSCNDDADNGRLDAESILNNPPYASLTDSIEQFPDNVQLRLRRGTMLAQKNLHELATGDFERSWELTNDENIGLEYASNLLLTGNEQKALRFLEDGVKQFPNNPEYKRRLAEVHAQLGDSRKAILIYDSLLSADQENFEAWYDKGMLQAQTGDTLGAIESLERSYSIMPLNHSALSLAQILISQKDPRALEICNSILAKDSGIQQIDALYLKGVYYSETGQPAKAVEQFDLVIQRDWKMTDAYLEKGIIYLDQKNYRQALETFNMATTVSNTNADAWFWVGRTYEAMGNKQQAIINYQRALSLEPEFTEAQQRLRKLKLTS